MQTTPVPPSEAKFPREKKTRIIEKFTQARKSPPSNRSQTQRSIAHVKKNTLEACSQLRGFRHQLQMITQVFWYLMMKVTHVIPMLSTVAKLVQQDYCHTVLPSAARMHLSGPDLKDEK